MSKILKACGAFAAENRIWNYAVVHARAPGRAGIYAQKLTGLLGRPPLFINDVAPVIGVHAGDGTVAVALLAQ